MNRVSRQKKREGTHGYSLHLLDVFRSHRVRTTTGQQSFAFHGPSVRISLTQTLRDSSLPLVGSVQESVKYVFLRSRKMMNTIQHC